MKVANIEATLMDHMGSDLSVVNAARVSFHKESVWDYEDGKQSNCCLNERDIKLINYLAKHKHFSPFNHTFLTFRVKAPIFVARQLVKHKFMPWNEVSRRYVDEEPEFFLPDSWRARPENNVKQGSGDSVVSLGWDCDLPKMLIDASLEIYQKLLEKGVAPEQARMVLPQNTMTEWIWSGTLGAFCDMLKLRLDSHTQHETSVVAEKIKNIILPLFPVSVPALLEN